MLKAVNALLDEAGARYQRRAGGMWGIGKTWLIEELRDRCLKDGRAIILYVSLVDMVPDADPTRSRTNPAVRFNFIMLLTFC